MSNLRCRRASTQEVRTPFIRTDAGIITQINTFTGPEGGQQPLIELLEQANIVSTDS